MSVRITEIGKPLSVKCIWCSSGYVSADSERVRRTVNHSIVYVSVARFTCHACGCGWELEGDWSDLYTEDGQINPEFRIERKHPRNGNGEDQNQS